MGSFCGQCGAPVGVTGFCVKCGAPIDGTAKPAAPSVAASKAAVPKAGMSSGMKLAMAAGAVVFVGGTVAAAGIFYVAHRATQKLHEIASGVAGDRHAAGSASSSLGDPCRYLSKQDVSRAIGVEIVAALAEGVGCSYMAKGNQGDMSAKHAAKMLGAKGADEKTQKMIQDFAGGIFKSMPQEKQDQGTDASGNVPVLSVSVSDSESAMSEMKLNAKVLKNLGGGKTGQDLQIGDEAFVSSDSMIMIRKGDKIVRIMYMTCPCGTAEIKPLAAKLAAAL